MFSVLPRLAWLTERVGTAGAGSPAGPSSSPVSDILVTAVWFGLVTGLVEGLALWILQRAAWLAGPFTFLGSSLEIVWIAPLFDLLLFGALGLGLALIAWLLPERPIVLLSMIMFAGLAIFDWLALLLVGRVSIYAVFILAAGLAVQSARWLHERHAVMARFWRRSVAWVVVLAFLALAGIQGGCWSRERIATAELARAAAGSPNILVIVVDTLRADHLSSYGYPRPTSPNLDRIARGGVLFENAFATSSWTKPSHASLVTGRYTYEHGADAYETLDSRHRTIAEVLRDRGYRTGAFSANVGVFNRRQGFGRGFIHFEDFYRTPGDIVIGTVYGRVIETYALHRMLGFQAELGRKWATDINDAVLRWIGREEGHPFFVFLNYYDPHAPYVPPQPFRGQFSKQENPGGLINTYWDMSHIYVPLTREQLQGEIDAYDGAIAYVDHHVGRLLTELEERGFAENTLVVITSDHGELFGEHDLFEHTNSLYREVIHVPLIIRWSGQIPAGVRIAQPVSNVSLPATLLDLLGEEPQTVFPGPALTQLWERPGLQQEWPNPLAEIAQIPWVPAQHLPAYGEMKSVISPQWHYIVHEEFGEELYDWSVDPAESTDLVENPELSSVVDQLRDDLDMFIATLSAWLDWSRFPS